ncbi:hypothetical protein D3C73_1345050 [compost metagenome]
MAVNNKIAIPITAAAASRPPSVSSAATPRSGRILGPASFHICLKPVRRLRTERETGTTRTPWRTDPRKPTSTETPRVPAMKAKKGPIASANSASELTDSRDMDNWNIPTVTIPMKKAPMACTISAEPNMEAALRRIVWKEPSRISPNCSGRRGMTPGFGGAT